MKDQDLKLGMAALEHARDGGQVNVSPEMATALIERMAYIRELCGRAAKDVRDITDHEQEMQLARPLRELEAVAKGDA